MKPNYHLNKLVPPGLRQVDLKPRRTTVLGLALCVATVLGVTSAAVPTGDGHESKPLLLKEQGSFFVGGELVFCRANDGEDINNPRYPPGHVVIHQLYTQYQVPLKRKFSYPVILVHGGGHTGKVYETTPDGREGWRTLLVRKGFTTYVVDDPNRGRSGSEIYDINLVRLGLAPPTQLPHLNRYPAESAWVNFRWGPAFGGPYPNTQFPIEAADQYYAQLITSYRDPEEDQKIVHGLVALLDKVGPTVLLTWSQSGPLGLRAAVQRPDLVKGFVALEPAGYEGISSDSLDELASIPIEIVIGDNNATGAADARGFAEMVSTAGGDVTVDVLPELGIFGNGHTMMVEKNNKQILNLIVQWLKKEVPGL